jgi:hypothetical protein
LVSKTNNCKSVGVAAVAVFIVFLCVYLITKPDFSPNIPGLSPNYLEKNPVLFPSGNFARRAEAAKPHWNLGRTGNFQVPPLHTWSEGHDSFKTNVQTLSTAGTGPANRTPFQYTGPRAVIFKIEDWVPLVS